MGTPDDEVAATMGSADALLNVGRDSTGIVSWMGYRTGPTSSLCASSPRRWFDRGELVFSTLVEPDTGLDNPVLHGMYDLGSGTAPTAPGEAAVNERLLDSFGAEIGDDIEIGEHQLRVTGIVEARDLEHPIAIVGSGTLTGRNWSPETSNRSAEGCLCRIVGAADACPLASGLHHARRDRCVRCKRSHDLGSCLLVGGILALFATGLNRLGWFVVGARRQLRGTGIGGCCRRGASTRASCGVGRWHNARSDRGAGSEQRGPCPVSRHPSVPRRSRRPGCGTSRCQPARARRGDSDGDGRSNAFGSRSRVDCRQVECHGDPCWSNGTTPTTGKGRCLRAHRSDSWWRRH